MQRAVVVGVPCDPAVNVQTPSSQDPNYPLATKPVQDANLPPTVFIVSRVEHTSTQMSDEDEELHWEDKEAQPVAFEIQSYSRKDKSLSVLCHHFLKLFCVVGQEICLHKATNSLSLSVGAKVERRRIYDIVNVLESVAVLERRGKNKYCWLGTVNIPKGLEQLQKAKYFMDDTRRENSLGNLSRAFIKLFLSGQHETVSLEAAATQLIGFMEDSQRQRATPKVRRLYDIANVLTSIGLIRKVKIPNSRKPGFCWAGPDPASLAPRAVSTPLSYTSDQTLAATLLARQAAKRLSAEEAATQTYMGSQVGTSFALSSGLAQSTTSLSTTRPFTFPLTRPHPPLSASSALQQPSFSLTASRLGQLTAMPTSHLTLAARVATGIPISSGIATASPRAPISPSVALASAARRQMTVGVPVKQQLPLATDKGGSL